jgi:hypothetical protein
MDLISVSTPYTQTDDVLTCNLGDMANGATSTLVIVVRETLIPGASGTDNLAVGGELSFVGTDPDSGNNTASSDIFIMACGAVADLAVVMTFEPNLVYVNDEVTYTLTVTNNGGGGVGETGQGGYRQADASGIMVTTTLPAGMNFVSASSGCSANSGVVTCNIGSLPELASAMLTITVRAPAAPATALLTRAVVSGTVADPVPSNNVASVTFNVTAAAPVPTLSEWGMILLAILLAFVSIRMVRRREAV